MADNYLGQPRPVYQQDLPSDEPGPGVAPTILIPGNADPSSREAFFEQQYRALANFIAYSQKTIGLWPPIAGGSSGTTRGYTNATYTGSSSLATVTATGGGHNPYHLVVKIILGGSVGVATFQLSTDGGKNFGSTTTTASTVTVGQVTISFNSSSGPFVTGGRYELWATDTPQLILSDAAGHVRHMVGHDGVGIQRISQLRQEWIVTPGLTTATGDINGIGSWEVAIAGANGYVKVEDANEDYQAGHVELQHGDANGRAAILGTKSRFLCPTPDLYAVAVWEGWFTGGTGTQQVIGFSDLQSILSTGKNMARFEFNPSQSATNIVCVTSRNGAAPYTITDSGVALPNYPTFARFRIELCGANTYWGKNVRFFIDEKLVAVHTTNVPFDDPQQPMGFQAGTLNLTAGASLSTMGFGPILCEWFRHLSLPAL